MALMKDWTARRLPVTARSGSSVVHRDATGVHVSYDKPSSVFGSLGSAAIDTVAAGLDDKIRVVVEEACR